MGKPFTEEELSKVLANPFLLPAECASHLRTGP